MRRIQRSNKHPARNTATTSTTDSAIDPAIAPDTVATTSPMTSSTTSSTTGPVSTNDRPKREKTIRGPAVSANRALPKVPATTKTPAKGKRVVQTTAVDNAQVGADDSPAYFHQLNTYFGIRYPVDMADKILTFLGDNKRFTDLNSESQEAVIDDTTIVVSMNSDNDEQANIGFIFVDDMTIESDDYSKAEGMSVTIYPDELLRVQVAYRRSVTIMQEIHTLLLKKFKKEGKWIQCGWFTAVCTWYDEPDNSNDVTDDSSDSLPLPGTTNLPVNKTVKRGKK